MDSRGSMRNWLMGVQAGGHKLHAQRGTTSMSVVLSAPEEPMSAVMRPGRAQKLTFWKKSMGSPLMGMV
jgi:hypothetical protein